jgi:hypothetical protein
MSKMDLNNNIKINRVIIIILFGVIVGLFWMLIYLIFFDLHGMTRMFNSEFIFLIASIVKYNIASKSMGVLFSFSDGFMAGILFGVLFVKFIYRKR